MGVIVCLQSGHYFLFLKGVLETPMKKCLSHIIISKNPNHTQHTDSDIKTKTIDNISWTIIFYMNQILRTIVLCYWDFKSWPPCLYPLPLH